MQKALAEIQDDNILVLVQYSGSRLWRSSGQLFKATISPTFIIKYGEVTFLSIVGRQKFSIISTIWKMPEEGSWRTTHHLLLSLTLPSSPPVLDRIAVDSTEHQMKWLACTQEPCCTKKCTFSLNTETTFSEVRCFLRSMWSWLR